MLKLAGEFIEGQLADHAADLDAHTRDLCEILRTGEYHFTLPLKEAITDNALTANHLYVTPFLVPRAMTFDRIAIDVSGAGAGGTKARLGIYNDGTNLYPGTLVVDAGTVDVDGTGVKAATISQSLTKGLYWLALVTDGTPTVTQFKVQPSPLGVSSANFASIANAGWDVAQAYGALPDPFTAGGSLLSERCLGLCLRLLTLD